ncbi:hypothetical protein [Rufibacter immobilis]|uniref:hypothetical protein n=1 Tax=Rufibacter immobilis TaxID=1348778 RepID=UPI0035EC859B
MAIGTFTGFDTSEDEMEQLVTLNLVEGHWIMTDLIYEFYINDQLQKDQGEREEPNAPCTFAGGKFMSPGEETCDYTFTKVDGKDYITLAENGEDKGTYQITKLTTTEMEWVITETLQIDSKTTHKDVSIYKFKKQQ